MVRSRRIGDKIKRSRLRNIRKGCRTIRIQFSTGNRVTAKRTDSSQADLIARSSSARLGPRRDSTASPLRAHTRAGQNVFQTVLQHHKHLTGQEIRHAWTSSNGERNASRRCASWR